MVDSSTLVMNAFNSETAAVGEPRLRNRQAAPAVWPAMLALQQVANQNQLEPRLVELVKLRASQINRCAYCIDLHFRQAAARGESPDRLYLLSAWEDAGRYSPRERAALRWTEALTRLAETGVPDEVFAEASARFSEAELLQLSLVVVAINGWNRLHAGFRIPPDAP